MGNNKALVNKILITLGFLFCYRVLAYVPVPGVNIEVIKSFFEDNSNNALGLFNMFSGGAAARLSIISLGIMPYITASIVMELLAATFPNLGKMKKERDGMQKYMQIIRYATIGITLVQAIGVSIGLENMPARGGQSAILDGMLNSGLFIPITCISMLVGTMLLMWIGEQITQRGIGNGISLIIFAGIVSRIPSAIGNFFNSLNISEINFFVAAFIIIIVILTIGIIIYIEMGERRIPISYSRKTIMQNQHKRIMNYIPIKVNLSGVIPPIFASAILTLPTTMLHASTNPYLRALDDWLNPSTWFFHILSFLFVIFFAFFYASIAFNSKDISENLKRQGGFIPGVRPGESTSKFLNDIASKLTIWGALYLGLITTIPWLLTHFLHAPFYFGGTSVLIVVSVALDTMRRIEAHIYMNKYQTLGSIGL